MKRNRLLAVATVEQFLRWWPFFLEGLEFLRKNARWETANDEFFRHLLYILGLGESRGFLGVLVSGAGQPLGFVVAVDTSSLLAGKQAQVYALFSNGRSAQAFTELCAEAEQWAKGEGYENLVVVSYRLSRAATRWFSEKLGFDRRYTVYSKSL